MERHKSAKYYGMLLSMPIITFPVTPHLACIKKHPEEGRYGETRTYEA